MLTVTKTTYSYSAPLVQDLPGTLSFTADWLPNDVPGFHKASFAHGNLTFAEGAHDYSIDLATARSPVYFFIENSDSLAGPSTLKVSNLKWTVEYEPVSIIETVSAPYAIRFISRAAPPPVPEPEVFALMLAGLVCVGARFTSVKKEESALAS